MAITIPVNSTTSELVLLALTIQAKAKASIVVAIYSHIEPPYHRFLDEEIAVKVFDVLSTTMDLLASMGKVILDSNSDDEIYRLIENFCVVWLFVSNEYKVELSTNHVHLADNIVEWEDEIKLLKSFVEVRKLKVG